MRARQQPVGNLLHVPSTPSIRQSYTATGLTVFAAQQPAHSLRKRQTIGMYTILRLMGPCCWLVQHGAGLKT